MAVLSRIVCLRNFMYPGDQSRDSRVGGCRYMAAPLSLLFGGGITCVTWGYHVWEYPFSGRMREGIPGRYEPLPYRNTPPPYRNEPPPCSTQACAMQYTSLCHAVHKPLQIHNEFLKSFFMCLKTDFSNFFNAVAK